MSNATIASVAAGSNPFTGVAAAALPGLRVLSVDDTPICRKLVEHVLSRAGHSVVSACDGREALDLIDKSMEDFDVVITDHHMPWLDGLGLVRELRARGCGSGIVVISAGLDAAAEVQYRALGVSLILRKPASVAEIRHAVNRAPRSEVSHSGAQLAFHAEPAGPVA